MSIVPDDLYISSPSSHMVPCSPHVTHTRGSPAHVPDIDQNSSERRGQFSPLYQRHTTDLTSTPPTILRNPYLNLTETGYVNSFNSAQNNMTPTSSQISEQVVPNCSPYVSSQRSVPTDLSQKLSQETELSQKTQEDTTLPPNVNKISADKNVEEEVPLDEKAPTVQERKRQNRTLLVAQNARERVKQLFDTDEIFD